MAISDLAALRMACVPDSDVPTVPRILSFVTVKRNIPRFRDTYGHWWIEIDGVESYGWWADHCPFSIRGVLFGTRGVLNGVGGTCPGGTPTTDPRHGDDADFCFHPTLTVPKSDSQVRAEIRSFAQSYAGVWGWPWWWAPKPMTNCHTFHLALLQAVGMTEGPELFYTRGPGCPFMFPLRRGCGSSRTPSALSSPARKRSLLSPRDALVLVALDVRPFRRRISRSRAAAW